MKRIHSEHWKRRFKRNRNFVQSVHGASCRLHPSFCMAWGSKLLEGRRLHAGGLHVYSRDFTGPLWDHPASKTPRNAKKVGSENHFLPANSWSRGRDLNLRPPGYEPGELPDCSTPQYMTRFSEVVSASEKLQVKTIRAVSHMCK